MTTAQKLTFPPLEIDEFDAKIDARAAQRGIPTLKSPGVEEGVPGSVPVRSDVVAAVESAEPKPQKTASRKMSPTRQRMPQGMKPAERSVRRASPDAEPTPRARMIPLNVEVPDYVWVALKSRAAENFTSVRYHILKLLAENGIAIAEADLIEDGRRLRQGRERNSDTVPS